MPSLNVAFDNGVASTPSWGQKTRFTFANTWEIDDTWSINVLPDVGDKFYLGLGYFDGEFPVFVLTYKLRVYAPTAKRLVFSDNDAPTGFGRQNPGAGYI